MLDVLLSGKIGKIKYFDGEEQMFCSFIAFSESAQNALLALNDGEAVFVAGSAKLKVWTNNKGEAKPQLDVTVSNVLTVYSIKKKREKAQGSEDQHIESKEEYTNKMNYGTYSPSSEKNHYESKPDDSIPF